MSSNHVNGMYTNLVVPHGTNLHSERFLTPAVVSSALSATVSFLKGNGWANSDLYRYDDWWQHDGLHLSRGAQDELIGFDNLADLVATPDALRTSMPGDYEVFVGVAPASFEWYLRFYHDIAGCSRRVDGEIAASFDITLPNGLVDEYRQHVVIPLGLEMREQESIAYYLSIGMGSYPYSETELLRMQEASQEELKRLMSDISERCFSAVWMDGTEFMLWKAVVDGPMSWGHDDITEEDIVILKRLAARTGGWIRWDESTEETFVPMQVWLQSYSALKAAN